MKRFLHIILLAKLFILIFIFLPLPSAATAIPSSPASAAVEVKATNQILLSWQYDGSAHTGFKIYRSKNESTYEPVATLGASSRAYTDYNVAVGQLYTYKITAYNNTGESSGYITDTAAVLSPSELILTPKSDTSIEVSFSYPDYQNIDNTDYTTIIERRASSSSTWQVVNETTPGVLKFTDQMLDENKLYYYRIRTKYHQNEIKYTFPNNSTGDSVYTLLKKPTSFKSQIISTNSIKLSWQDNTSQETGYKIERKVDNGEFTLIATITKDKVDYTDATITSGHVYAYRIKAYNSYTSSLFTDEASINYIVPTDITLTAISDEQVDVSWSYPEADTFSLSSCSTIIERRERDSEWVEIGKIEHGNNLFHDYGLTKGTLYYYRLIPVFNDNIIPSYTIPNNSTGKSIYTLLNDITGLCGYASSLSSIHIEWDNQGTNILYDIERKTENDAYIKIKTGISDSSYIDTYVVESGKKYTYRITSKNNLTSSSPSYAITITAELLTAPKDIKVQNIDNKAAYVRWEDDSTRETGYEVWRKTMETGIWELHYNLKANATYYLDESILPNMNYQYKIRCIKNETILSPFSDIVSMSTMIPNPPEILMYKPLSSTEYLFKWIDFSDIETDYILYYRYLNGSTWHVGSSVVADSTLAVWSPPKHDTWYEVYVSAVNDNFTEGQHSNTILLYNGRPLAPKISQVEHLSDDKIQILWKSTTLNESEYYIERKSNSDNTYKQIAIINDAEALSYTDTNIIKNKTYYYRIRSKNAVGFSDYSSVYEIKTSLPQIFKDLNNKHWAYGKVDYLYRKGYINGVGNNKFSPDTSITRAEFVRLIVSTFKLEATPVGSFADVNPNHWFYSYVMIANYFAIAPGNSKDYFRPTDPITREEMAYMTYKAIIAKNISFKGYAPSVLDQFKDTSKASPYAIPALSVLVGNEIISGRSGGLLAPTDRLSRAEAASIIYSLIFKYDLK